MRASEVEILFINIYVDISWLSPEGISKHQPSPSVSAMGLYAWHEGLGAPARREAEDIPEVFLLLSDVAALLDARLLTGEGTEVVELSATYLPNFSTVSFR